MNDYMYTYLKQQIKQTNKIDSYRSSAIIRRKHRTIHNQVLQMIKDYEDELDKKVDKALYKIPPELVRIVNSFNRC